MNDKISIIITVHNGEKWIDGCFNSILGQSLIQTTRPRSPLIEVCICEDCSTDQTVNVLEKWRADCERINVAFHIIRNFGIKRGVGYGRNKAISVSSGNYLCFQDIDDEMLPTRLEKQYEMAKKHKNAIIGSRFLRIPANSTCRFSRWANELRTEQLELQIYTSNGPTILMPTWFCHHNVFNAVKGGFCENGHGTPEDLIFFFKHLENNGEVMRVDEPLLYYRYHPDATTFSISSETIWHLRLQHLLKHVLSKKPWSEGFTIWNAGKQGRRFFRDLPIALKKKIVAFCDVDSNKINKHYQYYNREERRFTFSIPVIHFSKAKPPLLICMKLDMTNGDFEANLKSLNLYEGIDYILFT